MRTKCVILTNSFPSELDCWLMNQFGGFGTHFRKTKWERKNTEDMKNPRGRTKSRVSKMDVIISYCLRFSLKQNCVVRQNKYNYRNAVAII